MAVIINYYTDENKHEYQCSYWGRDGLYIKAIKGNFYIFYNRKYLGKVVGKEQTYKFLSNLNEITDKRSVFNNGAFIKLCNRVLKWC